MRDGDAERKGEGAKGRSGDEEKSYWGPVLVALSLLSASPLPCVSVSPLRPFASSSHPLISANCACYTHLNARVE